jgi:hypothetical protein
MTCLRILGVHGVKNHQGGLEPAVAAERLAGWWTSAVRKGLGLSEYGESLLTINMAYYAHRLHLGTAQGEDDPGLLDPDVQELIVSWSKLCGAPQETAQGWLGSPARAAADWVACKWGLDQKIVRILAAAFFREVQTYFTDADRRTAATNDVAAAVESTAPQVIIAHSLGSAVIYETLWAHAHPPIDLLITIGSPLAMPDIVYHRLRPHAGPRGRPPGVVRWINISDPGDFIAIPVGGISGSFRNVGADLTDAIGAFDFHQVGKYLRCGATAGALAAYLPSTDVPGAGGWPAAVRQPPSR